MLPSRLDSNGGDEDESSVHDYDCQDRVISVSRSVLNSSRWSPTVGSVRKDDPSRIPVTLYVNNILDLSQHPKTTDFSLYDLKTLRSPSGYIL